MDKLVLVGLILKSELEHSDCLWSLYGKIFISWIDFKRCKRYR